MSRSPVGPKVNTITFTRVSALLFGRKPIMPSPCPYSHEALSSHEDTCVRVTWNERARIYANRVHYSRVYAALYAAALILSGLLLVWVLLEKDYPLRHAVKFWIFVLADGAVTLFMVLEVMTRALAAGGCRHFLLEGWNVFDIFVTLLCISTIFLHVVGPTKPLDVEVEVIVLCVRYGAQALRLLVLVRNFGRMQRAQGRELEIHMDAGSTVGDGSEHDMTCEGRSGDASSPPKGRQV